MDDGGSDRITSTTRTQPALDARAVEVEVVGERTVGVAGWAVAVAAAAASANEMSRRTAETVGARAATDSHSQRSTDRRLPLSAQHSAQHKPWPFGDAAAALVAWLFYFFCVRVFALRVAVTFERRQ